MGNLHTYTTGADVSESVRPGSTVALTPVLTNNGDIHEITIIVMNLLTVNGSPDFDYEVNSSWI